MGRSLITFFRRNSSPERALAFLSAFVITLLVHLYKFTNTLPNHDSLFNYYTDQNILGSGRWALSTACALSSYYDLPWVIGLLSCLWIGLTVIVITELFHLRDPVLIVLTGAFLSASPATTETFFFLYTADGYMLAMLLAALGAWLSRIEETRISRLILSGVCICISCGIYQAYVSFALLLALCSFMMVLLQNNHSRKQCFSWILRQVIVYTGALAAYYIIWKLLLQATATPVNAYQGIEQVGTLRPDVILGGFLRAARSVILYFIQWDVLAHGFSLYSILNILFLLFCGAGLILSLRGSGILGRKWALGLLILCLAAIVPFAGIWHFVSGSVGYRPMMLQSLTVLYLLSALLFENWAKPFFRDCLGLLLLVVILNQALMANISYYYMNLCYEQTYADGLEMLLEIHDRQDEADFQKIAVLGTRIYDVQFENADPETGRMNASGQLHILTSGLEKTLLFDGEHTVRFLSATFGLDLEPVSREVRDELLQLPEVRAMGCWPREDSILVLDDTLILKLSDRPENPSE